MRYRSIVTTPNTWAFDMGTQEQKGIEGVRWGAVSTDKSSLMIMYDDELTFFSHITGCLSPAFWPHSDLWITSIKHVPPSLPPFDEVKEEKVDVHAISLNGMLYNTYIVAEKYVWSRFQRVKWNSKGHNGVMEDYSRMSSKVFFPS